MRKGFLRQPSSLLAPIFLTLMWLASFRYQVLGRWRMVCQNQGTYIIDLVVTLDSRQPSSARLTFFSDLRLLVPQLPILFMSNTADPVTPLASTRSMAGNFGNESASLVIQNGGDVLMLALIFSHSRSLAS